MAALFCLGDLGGLGPHPERVGPLLRAHGVAVVGGNYDEALAAGAADCSCDYTDPRDNHYARVSYAYTVARTPRRINEFLWESTTPDGLVRRLLADHAADVLLCTHTGLAWHRALDGGAGHAVNVGAIGRPANDGTPDVWYALLSAEPDVRVELVRVAYDYEPVARAIEAEGLPPKFAQTVRTGWWTTCLENLPARERARGRF